MSHGVIPSYMSVHDETSRYQVDWDAHEDYFTSRQQVLDPPETELNEGTSHMKQKTINNSMNIVNLFIYLFMFIYLFIYLLL